MSQRQRLLEIYSSGEPLPWDDQQPPPEVQQLVAERAPGRALDLGCGYGRTAIYLAQRGWQVDAVDFIEKAIDEAQRRAATADVAPRFHLADVTQLDFLAPPYQLAVDVGCAHGLSADLLFQYARQLQRLLAPAADLLIYARLNESGDETQRGLVQPSLYEALRPAFTLISVDRGEQDEFHAPWPSAWYHFQRVSSAALH